MDTQERPKVDPKQARELLKALGYTHEHTWRDSHGNGHHEIFQAPGDSEEILTLVITREGYLDRLWPEGQRKNYRKAREIRADLKKWEKHDRDADDYDPDYEIMPGSNYVSACATSSSFKVKDRYGDIWHVSSAAGHGEAASKEKYRDPYFKIVKVLFQDLSQKQILVYDQHGNAKLIGQLHGDEIKKFKEEDFLGKTHADAMALYYARC
jgi:hypothetical protein